MTDIKEKIDCTDIYRAATERSIKTLKRFREAWLRSSSSSWSDELFQYADLDFYFYRFAIDRQEKNTEPFLTNILYQVMERYGLSFEIPDDLRNAPFIFIINDNGSRKGYRLIDFYSDEDVNAILDMYDVERGYIIRTSKPGRADEWIERDNDRNKEDGIRLTTINIKTFFEEYFGEDEYHSFLNCIEEYLKEAKEITGYQSIKFLSSMNLASRKIYEEKLLTEWDYKNYKYQIVDPKNELVQDYLYLISRDKVFDDLEDMEKAYIERGLFRSMIGTNEYAESFITSEWLYYSLKGRKNFDYTSVVSGYLKSIEQLLYQIVMLNIDNGCKISMKSSLLKKAYDNGLKVYESKKYKWVPLATNDKGKGYKFTKFPYIDFTSSQKAYMDSSIGTFEYFMRNNPQIFHNKKHSKTIADMVSCFRSECRNGFFHTHNLQDWDIVEKTRNNAIYLYFVLLGSCIIPEEKEHELGILAYDEFDDLCRKIREFRHYNVNFIFEYDDGIQQKLIYDPINNTAEYTDDGVEHYGSLLFYKVDDFDGALEQLEEGIREEQIFYLTRENLPKRIFGVHRKIRNHELEEIEFDSSR